MKSDRFNKGKPKWGLLLRSAPEAMLELLKAREFGAAKYGAENWSLSIGTGEHDNFRDSCLESLQRHANELFKGKRYDETQNRIHHAAFIGINAIFILAYDLRERL